MKEGKKAADVEKALQYWTSSMIDPQLKPVQAKTRQLAEAALSLASSLESRCREFIRNTKYDMSGLGDSRRLRAAMALNRVSGEIVTASGDFLKSSPNESISNLENSRLQLEKEIHQLIHNEGSLLEAIERIESNSAIRALNAKEAELKALRKRLLNEEMSRLGGLFTKVLSLHQRGEVHVHLQA